MGRNLVAWARGMFSEKAYSEDVKPLRFSDVITLRVETVNKDLFRPNNQQSQT